MKKELKLTLAALTLVAGVAGLAEACSGCGCRAPRPKKTDATCESGVCAVTDVSKLGKAGCETCAADRHAHNLSTFEVKAAVESGAYIILDARGGKFFNGELIPGAKHLPANSDEAAITAVAPDKSAQIITYCSNTKCPASKKLAEKLSALGYENIKEYPEGLAGWKAAGGKTVRAK